MDLDPRALLRQENHARACVWESSDPGGTMAARVCAASDKMRAGSLQGSVKSSILRYSVALVFEKRMA